MKGDRRAFRKAMEIWADKYQAFSGKGNYELHILTALGI